MAYSDIKNRIFYVTQKIQQRNRLKKISGAEPITKTGKTRTRSGRLVYGLVYTKGLIKVINGRQKIRDKKGRYWNIQVLEAGKSPFQEKFGKPKKQMMGKIKHKISKHKFTGYNSLPFSELTKNTKRRGDDNSWYYF